MPISESIALYVDNNLNSLYSKISNINIFAPIIHELAYFSDKIIGKNGTLYLLNKSIKLTDFVIFFKDDLNMAIVLSSYQANLFKILLDLTRPGYGSLWFIDFLPYISHNNINEWSEDDKKILQKNLNKTYNIKNIIEATGKKLCCLSEKEVEELQKLKDNKLLEEIYRLPSK